MWAIVTLLFSMLAMTIVVPIWQDRRRSERSSMAFEAFRQASFILDSSSGLSADAFQKLLIVSTTVWLATSPMACPPMPSQMIPLQRDFSGISIIL